MGRRGECVSACGVRSVQVSEVHTYVAKAWLNLVQRRQVSEWQRCGNGNW